jgi:hypothetical protein
MPTVPTTAAGGNPAATGSVLMPGDVSIIGLQSISTPDTFLFVPLIDLLPGTVIYFTDNGYDSATNTFRGVTPTDRDGGEGITRFNATQRIPAGTIIGSEDASASFVWASSGNIVPAGGGVFSSMAFSQAGDQLIALQSSNLDNPMLSHFTAIAFYDNTGQLGPATTSATSELPPGLTLGLTATLTPPPVSSQFRQVFNTSTSSGTTQQGWLQLIGNASNWFNRADASILVGGTSIMVLTGAPTTPTTPITPAPATSPPITPTTSATPAPVTSPATTTETATATTATTPEALTAATTTTVPILTTDIPTTTTRAACIAALQHLTASNACFNCSQGSYAPTAGSTSCVAAVPLSFAFGESYDVTFSSASPRVAVFVDLVRQRVAGEIGWAADFVLEVRALRGSIVMQMLVPDSAAWNR